MAYGGREGGGRGGMESVVFIFSLIDCCALIFLSVYFVSFTSVGRVGLGLPPRPAGPKCGSGPPRRGAAEGERGRRWVEGGGA